MKYILSSIGFVIITLCGKSQDLKINWNVVSDSISLTPTKFESDGTFTIKYSSSAAPIQLTGNFIIYPKDKIIHYNSGENLIKFSNLSDILGISLNSYKYFSNDDLNSKDLYDSLLQHYRRNLFIQLELTEIEIQLSKRNKFEIINNELKVKKPILLKGKICEMELSSVVILTEEGDLLRIYDGEFNYLKIENLRALECKSLYDYFYQKYQDKLKEIIQNWKTSNLTKTIESFVENFGPFDKQYKIPNDRTIYVWNKKSIKYYINMSGKQYSRSNNYGSFYKNSNISPLFYYNNQSNYKYQSSFISGSTNPIVNSNSISANTIQTSQNGEVTSSEESIVITLIFDSNGKLIDSFQERLFANTEYGRTFRFISLTNY